MVYCKQCGNPVEDTDRFCEKCSSRLDESGSVLTMAQLSLETKEGAFNPDAVATQVDLLGFEVFGYRFVEKKATLLGKTYYSGTKVEGDTGVSATIVHQIFPMEGYYSKLLLDFAMNVEATDAFARQLVEEYVAKVEGYKDNCIKAKTPCYFKEVIFFHSEAQNCTHLFFLVEDGLPLMEYIKTKEITVREAVRICQQGVNSLAALHKIGIAHGSVADDNLFVTTEGTVYLGMPGLGTSSRALAQVGSEQAYRQQFLPTDTPEVPTGGSAEDIYGMGMVLFRLLNGYRQPFINIYQGQMGYKELLAAEESRRRMLVPQLPFYGQNAIGTAVVKAISPYGARFRTMEELGRILENSLNYLPAEELNKTAVKYEDLVKGVLLVPNVRTEPIYQQPIQRLPEEQEMVQVTRTQQAKENRRGSTVVKLLGIVGLVLLVIVVLLYRAESKRDRSYKKIEQQKALVVMVVPSERGGGDFNANYTD